MSESTQITSAAPPGPRFVLTGHSQDGKSTILRDGIPHPQATWPGSKTNAYSMYKCDELPPKVDAELSEATPAESLWAASYPHFGPKGGAMMRAFDFEPDSESPMHRTDSVDFGVILKGSMEMHMEDGTLVTLQTGDVFVQRGTQHKWKNTSGEWARALFVGIDAQPMFINGICQPDQMRDHVNLQPR